MPPAPYRWMPSITTYNPDALARAMAVARVANEVSFHAPRAGSMRFQNRTKRAMLKPAAFIWSYVAWGHVPLTDQTGWMLRPESINGVPLAATKASLAVEWMPAAGAGAG